MHLMELSVEHIKRTDFAKGHEVLALRPITLTAVNPNSSDLEAVQRLRYESYLAKGAITKSTSALLQDKFDHASNTLHFTASQAGDLLGSIRLHIVSADFPNSPATETFPEVFEQSLSSPTLILDPTRLVISPLLQGDSRRVVFSLLRLAFIAGYHWPISSTLATVRKRHAAFYIRHFRYVLKLRERPYNGLTVPMCLLEGDTQLHNPMIREKYPFMTECEDHVTQTLEDGSRFLSPMLTRPFGPSS